MDVVVCEGLTKRYGDNTALERLDLSVAEGQVFGFLGPNGAGKTTTLRILLGLVRPTTGRASVNGAWLPDPDGLSQVGAMIEEPAFYPWMTGRKNLEVFALCGAPLPHGASIDDALGAVDLSDVAGRRMRTYSQGMRQRLGLAVALMRRPRLLLLDEPTNGLDPAGIREFRALLQRLPESGTTVLLSSHVLAEIEQVCDRAAILSRGRLVEEGAVGELGSARRQVRITVEQGDAHAAHTALSRWPVRTAEPGVFIITASSGRDVNSVLAAAGIAAESVLVERARLEERFLQLTEDDGPEKNRHASPAR